jgi:hypothetical protein
MPTNKPNMIDALRAKHDPHYKLSGKVEGLEKGVSDQVSQIHKTISKSFVTQRKTLARVLGLEKRVNHLELQQAAEEQAKENLDEILSDIREEEVETEEVETEEAAEVGGTKTKVKPKTKKKPKAKKSKISASAFKKGTPFDDKFKERVMGEDKDGGYLSKEERIARFKGQPLTQPDDLKPSESSDEKKGGALAEILSGVNSIVETLKATKKQDKKQQSWLQRMTERFKRRKKEDKLEFKVFDGLKKTATKLLAPMKNAWSEFLGFIGKVILGRVLFKILEWMGNKENQGKLNSIIKFFEDWWPAMLAGYLLFGNALTGFAIGLLKNLVVWGAKLLATVIPALMKALAAMGPWGWAAAGTIALGTGAYLMTRGDGDDKTKEGEGGDTNVEATGDDTNVEAAGGDTNVKETGAVQKVPKMNKGGVVPGRGNTDTVPAMLTPGEFVMTKGAVQKYGVNTMESMNAAAGGTNKPTLMRGYNEGGKATPMKSEDLVAAVGPSLQIFMEQHNAAIDSDPDAIFGEHMRIEMDRDGKMPNFGKTIANMSEWAFNESVRMTQENESIPPEVKEALLKKMVFIRKQTLDNPNFKGDIAFDINKDIPGTAAHRLFLRAQADTTSPAALAGLSAEARARQMNRMGYFGGGLVQNFQGGGSVKFTGEQLKNTLGGGQSIMETVQMGRSAAKNRANIKPRKTATVITPSEKKKVTVAYEEEKQKIQDKPNTEKSEKKIPEFDVTLGRSPHKIKLLGISV